MTDKPNLEPPKFPPGFDLEMDPGDEPDSYWNRLALGWVNEPLDYQVTEGHLLQVMNAEAFVLAAYNRLLTRDNGSSSGAE